MVFRKHLKKNSTWVRGGQVCDHCPLQHAGSSTMYSSSVLILIFHFPHSLHVPCCCPSSLGHMCYLKPVRAFTYTLHVSPPRDGDPSAIPEVLKGPTMSFLHLVSKHLLLKLKKRGVKSPPCWWTSGAATLSSCPSPLPRDSPYRSTLIYYIISNHPCCWSCPEIMMLICHTILIRPCMWNVLVLLIIPSTFALFVFVPCMKSKIVVKSSNVSHTSSRMV